MAVLHPGSLSTAGEALGATHLWRGSCLWVARGGLRIIHLI